VIFSTFALDSGILFSIFFSYFFFSAHGIRSCAVFFGAPTRRSFFGAAVVTEAFARRSRVYKRLFA
jgi:hypothetical protein